MKLPLNEENAGFSFFIFSEFYKEYATHIKKLDSLIKQIKATMGKYSQEHTKLFENEEEKSYITFLEKILNQSMYAAQMLSRVYKFYLATNKNRKAKRALTNALKGKGAKETTAQKVASKLPLVGNSLADFLSGVNENQDTSELSKTWTTDEIVGFIWMVDDPKVMQGYAQAVLEFSNIPKPYIQHLADISIMTDSGKVPEDKYNVPLYKIMKSGNPSAIVAALENGIERVAFLLQGATTMNKYLLNINREVENDAEKYKADLENKGLKLPQIKLLLKYLHVAKQNNQITESLDRELDAKILNKFFSPAEKEELQAVFAMAKNDPEIFQILGWDAPESPEEEEEEAQPEPEEQPAEETRPYLKTNIQLSSKNANREFRALQAFFKAAKSWKPSANESLTPDDLKGINAKKQFVQFVVDYINTIGPNDQDMLRAVFNREGNKSLIAQYIKDEIVMKNSTFQSMKAKVEVEIEKIMSSITSGNEWQIVLDDDLHTIEEVKYRVWTGDEEQVYLDLKKGYKILTPQQFLEMMEKGDIAMMRSKEELDAESAAKAAQEAAEAAAKVEADKKAEAEKQAQIAAQKAKEAEEAKARADEEAEKQAAKEAQEAADKAKSATQSKPEESDVVQDARAIYEKIMNLTNNTATVSGPEGKGRLKLTPEIVEKSIGELADIMGSYERAVKNYIKTVLKYSDRRREDFTVNEADDYDEADFRGKMRSFTKFSGLLNNIFKQHPKLTSKEQKEIQKMQAKIMTNLLKGKPIVVWKGKEKYNLLDADYDALSDQTKRFIYMTSDYRKQDKELRNMFDSAVLDAIEKTKPDAQVIPIKPDTTPTRPASTSRKVAQERLEKKLTPLVRTVMRVINGKEKLRY